MSTIARRLPQSNKTRQDALFAATDKKDSLPPSGNILTAATTTRLDAVKPSYETAMDAVVVKGNALRVQSKVKNSTRNTLDKLTRAFIKIFNIGIDIGKFLDTDLSFYNLPPNGTLPKLTADQDLINVGRDIIKGENNRVTGGGTPMSTVDIAEYATAYNDFKAALTAQSNKKDELDTAQEAVGAMNKEADAVIKKVWDEVETFYNEEEKDSQRANAREWGVVYITIGIKPSIISGTMLDANTNLPLPQSANPEVYLAGPDITAQVGADGTYLIETTFIGTSNITGLGIGYEDNVKPINVVEGSDNDVGFVMVPV